MLYIPTLLPLHSIYATLVSVLVVENIISSLPSGISTNSFSCEFPLPANPAR